jgi:hypothetical protein
MVAKYTVHLKDLKKSTKQEMKEHPWASERTAKRIARDHLSREGPGYPRADKVNDKIVQNINRKMGARPIRRKRPAPPNPLTRFAGNPFR